MHRLGLGENTQQEPQLLAGVAADFIIAMMSLFIEQKKTQRQEFLRDTR